MTVDRVTVAICTWNRAALLRVTLEALCHQRIINDVKWEVLVVDNNSKDNTAEVAKEFVGRLPIRYIFEPRQGKSNALNRVLDEAFADWILFTDDDVRLPTDWMAAYIHAAESADDKVAFLGGAVKPWFEVQPDPDLAEALPEVKGGFCEVILPENLNVDMNGVLPVGANCAIHRGRLNGLRFDVKLGPNARGRIIGEEHQLFRDLSNAGYSGVWVPAATLEHYVIPARLKLGHLCRMMFDLGRMNVLMNGVPVSRKLFRVPIWTVQQFLSALWHAGYNRLRGNRVEYFKQLATAVRRAGFAWQCFRGVKSHGK